MIVRALETMPGGAIWLRAGLCGRPAQRGRSAANEAKLVTAGFATLPAIVALEGLVTDPRRSSGRRRARRRSRDPAAARANTARSASTTRRAADGRHGSSLRAVPDRQTQQLDADDRSLRLLENGKTDGRVVRRRNVY